MPQFLFLQAFQKEPDAVTLNTICRERNWGFIANQRTLSFLVVGAGGMGEVYRARDTRWTR